MRICLDFKTYNNEIPVDYRRYFISFIKKSLSESNGGKYLETYYKDTNQKPFMFTVVFQQPQFCKDKVVFENNKIRMYFSVIDKNRTGFIFANCFLNMKGKKFGLPGGNSMTLLNVGKVKEEKILSNRVMFKTVKSSSILLREHDRESNKDIYYTTEDAEYNHKLENSIKAQCLSDGYTAQDIERIKLNSVVGKKLVIKNYGVLIDAVSGVFDISAPTHILNYLYTVGFGARKSMGFPYLEVVRGEVYDENS